MLVREVTDGPLVSWLLTSGLIQEEAALIQPAYYPPSSGGAMPLSDLVVPGASLDRDGFRYEHFGFSASSTGGAVTPTIAQFGLFYGWPPVATVPERLLWELQHRAVSRARIPSGSRSWLRRRHSAAV